MPRRVSFGLDQATGRGTANNAKHANGALARPGARLEAMSLQPAFALFAVPLALRRCNRLRAMTDDSGIAHGFDPHREICGAAAQKRI